MRTVFLGAAVMIATTMPMAPAPAQEWLKLVSGDEATGYSIEGTTKIDANSARALHGQNVPFVDFRDHNKWALGHVPGSVSCQNATEENFLSIVSKNETVVFYCDGPDCRPAVDAAAMAVGWGFTGIHYFADGFESWKASQLPIE